MRSGVSWESRIGRRLRLRDLHFLFAVVQSGSMAKAAAYLGVSQPVVSEAIADLENAVGVRLLDRSPRGVEPTLYGRALLMRGQIAFDELRQGIRDIEFLADPATGEIRIGCRESVSAGVLPRVIERFSRQYPGVIFCVEQYAGGSEPNFSDLRERKVDLILSRQAKLHGEVEFQSDLSVEKLFDDQLFIVTGIHSPWARRRKIDIAELADEPWILPPNTWNSLLLEKAFRKSGLNMPKVRVETFSVGLRTQLVATGRFITALPGSLLHANIKPFSLKVLPVDLPNPPWPFAIVTLRDRTLSPTVQLFIECARDVVKSMAPPS
jgi:DNA-binding transcriptional LysR family regulator